MGRQLVLVVEDESDIRELVDYNLTKAGFDVKSVVTGEEALWAAEDDPPERPPGHPGLPLEKRKWVVVTPLQGSPGNRFHESSSTRTTHQSRYGQRYKRLNLVIRHVNLEVAFYCLTTMPDGYPRFVVDWEIRTLKTQRDEIAILPQAGKVFS